MNWYIIFLSIFIIFINVIEGQYKSFSESKFDLPDNLPAEDPLFQLQKDERHYEIKKPDVSIVNSNIDLGKPMDIFGGLSQLQLPTFNQQPIVHGLGFQQITSNSINNVPPSGVMVLPEMLPLPQINEINGIPQTPPLPYEGSIHVSNVQPSKEHVIPKATSLPTGSMDKKIYYNNNNEENIKKEKSIVAHAIPNMEISSPIDIHKNNRFNGIPRIVKPHTIYKNPRDEKSIIPSTSFSSDPPSSAITNNLQVVNNNDGYFKELYNITDCPRDSRYMADLFYQKFPKNILSPGKDIELVNLLGPRLEQCYLKKEKRHWYKVETFFGKIKVIQEEEENCKIGLIQEQIACMNLISYSCQFVQHDYQFKLIAARVVLGEARQAEAGENKCREVVKGIKQFLMSGR
uniref:Uncharacterized protein n=1 Tax=Parastrongyloides trichosuri TaxID=131310 RepID=A0A0N4ZQB0_PARTI